MTPAEFKQARQSLGLSTNALAAILGVGGNTVRKWENEGGSTARKPNEVACRALQWMLDGFRPPEWPSSR